MTIQFPKQFSDHATSSKVEEKDIQLLVDSVVETIEENPELSGTYVASGNTIVFAYRVHPEDGGGIHIVVSEDYKEGYIGNEIFSKDL